MKKIVDKLLNNKLVYVLVSLVASFVLWVFVVNSVNPSQVQNLSFEVQYEGLSVMEAYNLRLASDNPDRITLRVEASITEIHRLQENPYIIVDVSGIHDAGEHDVNFRLAGWTALSGTGNYRPIGIGVSNSDNTVIIRANRITGRTMELMETGINYEIADTEAEDYFFVGERMIEPEIIQIDGPEEILDRIASIEVVSDFHLPLSETLTQEGSLNAYDEYGDLIPVEDLLDVVVFQDTPFAEATINATVIVRMVKNVPIHVAFEYGAGANEENVRYHLSQESVWLIGESEVLRNLEWDLLGRIYLARLDMLEVVHREIATPPMTAIFEGAEYVDVEIEMFGLEERTITIPSTRIVFTGLINGMLAEASIDTITLVIRGPAELLETLDESNITVQVDLSDYADRTGRHVVEAFTVRVGEWPPEIIGARDLPGHGIIVNLQRS